MLDLVSIPLSGLRAVEAVARLGGLRGAAKELGVSEGAVSQQVRKVETRIGWTLFERRPSGMRPTARAVPVCAHLARGMAELARASRLAMRRDDDTVTVSVSPVFASRWLVPRLGRFHAAHPGIRLRIDATVAVVDPGGDVDACIRSGTGGWPGLDAVRLAPQDSFPVCAPALAGRLTAPGDLARVPVLRDTHRPDGWPIWLAAAGALDAQPGAGPTFFDSGLCIEAAIAGQGVYLAWESLVRDALDAGHLAAPFPARGSDGRSYWFVTAGRAGPATRAFGRWLAVEMGAPLESAAPPAP